MTHRLTVRGTLTAAEDRTLRGRLAPFHRPGHTNLGRVVFLPDSITYPTTPEGIAQLNASLDHLDGRDRVAEWIAVHPSEDGQGLDAEWTALPTHGGDRLLAEFHAGTRTGISVELEPVVIRDGIAQGALIGCAFPEHPAFPEARLVAELAPDTADDDTEDTESPDDDTEDTESPDDTEENRMTAPRSAAAAAAPRDLLASASRGGGTQAPSTPRRLTAANASRADAIRLLAELATAQGARRQSLLAALSDITPASVVDQSVPAWIGELWSGNAYQRRIVPLLGQAPLTGLKVKGWRWVTKPAMGEYAGNKTAIPSNDVDTEPYEDNAQRFAGGHDIDRSFVDFPDPEFWDSYYAAMSESYARLTDAYAMRKLKEAATTFAPGTVPAGVPAGWGAVVDGALQVLEVGAPTFALVESTVWRDMILTGTDKFFEFLNASLSLTEGTLSTGNFKLVPVTSTGVGTASSATGLDRGEVIVGTTAAVKFRELGGGAPIRVQAENIAQAGVDAGCFGYAHLAVEDPRGLVITDLTADA